MSFKNSEKNYYRIMMIVNGIFFMLLHLTFVGFTNDEVYFIEYRKGFSSLFSVIVDRYLTDSSRVLSEFVLFFLIDKPFIMWQILDTLMCVLLFHSLYVILVNDKNSKLSIYLFMAVASYPFMHVGSAGWICTSLNFLWPLATATYALSGVVRRYRKEEIKVSSYVLYVIALIFAANIEQSSAVTVMLFGMAVVYAVMDKRNAWFEIVGFVIGVLGMIWAFTSPGNGERAAMEAPNWMPEFFDMTFVDKFRACAVFVFEHFVMIPDVIFFLFALVIAMAGISSKNKLFRNIIAGLPLLVDVIFTVPYFVRDFIIGRKRNYDFTMPATIINDSKTLYFQLTELLGLFIFILASVITIMYVIRDGKKKFAAIWVLGAGFAVRMALMLSPTMFASWHRTLIYMYFAFIYVAVLLIRQMFFEECDSKEAESRIIKIKKNLILLVLFSGIIVNLILTVGLQIRKGMM